MASQKELELQQIVYGALWDDGAATVVAVVDLESDRLPSLKQLMAKIAEKLRTHPQGDGVEVRLDGQRLGTSSRRALQRLEGTAGEAPTSITDGDRASLSGESTQYRALRYACTAAGCPVETYRSFHDARFLPTCESHKLEMELCA